MQKKKAFFFHSQARGPSRRRIGAHFFAKRPFRFCGKAFAQNLKGLYAKIPPGSGERIILTVSTENIRAKPWPNEKDALTLQSEKEGKLLANICKER